MKREKLDLFVVLDRVNTIYFSGMKCSNSVMLITQRNALFLTDFRYIEAATNQLKEYECVLMPQTTSEQLGKTIEKFHPRRVGFEGTASYGQYELLRRNAGRSELCEAGELPAGIRAVKDDQEIAVIAANQRLTCRVLERASGNAEPGMSERDLRRMVINTMLDAHGEEAFETIVASGPNSSKPHAVAGTRRARAGEYLLFDLGVKRDCYHSDMTRTFVLGRRSQKQLDVYNIVLDAQQQALAAIRPGVPCKEVDAAARQVITRAGYGEQFGHGTGHGVGLDIHEKPTLNARSEDVLREGMVVTVEPGIYIPGFGGVRIEDLVVVTASGYRNLTRFAKAPESIAI